MISLDPSIGLSFDEPTHRYTFDGEPMDSVTQVLGQYKKPFDSEAHSLRLSDDDPIKAAELRKEWSLKRDAACDAGDRIHAEAERVAWDLEHWKEFSFSLPKWQPHLQGKVRGLWRWYVDHIELAGGFLYPEAKVVWPEYRIAGTVDLLCSNYNGYPAICDFKQSKSIDVWDKLAYSNMCKPFQRGKLKLADTNYNAYRLQLSLYHRILRERYSFEAEELVIVHLKPSGSYQEYQFVPMRDHIDKILELR